MHKEDVKHSNGTTFVTKRNSIVVKSKHVPVMKVLIPYIITCSITEFGVLYFVFRGK